MAASPVAGPGEPASTPYSCLLGEFALREEVLQVQDGEGGVGGVGLVREGCGAALQRNGVMEGRGWTTKLMRSNHLCTALRLLMLEVLLVSCNLGGAATPTGDFPAILLLGSMTFPDYLVRVAPVTTVA